MLTRNVDRFCKRIIEEAASAHLSFPRLVEALQHAWSMRAMAATNPEQGTRARPRMQENQVRMDEKIDHKQIVSDEEKT